MTRRLYSASIQHSNHHFQDPQANLNKTSVTMQLTNILAFFALTAIAVAAPPKPLKPVVTKPQPPVINNQVVCFLSLFHESLVCDISLLAIP
jgi:hypothetical protein